MNLNPAPQGMIARAKAIILHPKQEWLVISAEQTSIASLFLGYAVILAAIHALAHFLRSLLFGYDPLGFNYRPGFVASLGGGISQYVLFLISVVIIAFVANYVITKFDGQGTRTPPSSWPFTVQRRRG